MDVNICNRLELDGVTLPVTVQINTTKEIPIDSVAANIKMYTHAYLSVGKLYFEHKNLQTKIIKLLDDLFLRDDFKIRQTVINATGEIGRKSLKWCSIF